jgi:hypothetical protein
MSHQETLCSEDTVITYKILFPDIRSESIPAIQQSHHSACIVLFTGSGEKLALALNPERRAERRKRRLQGHTWPQEASSGPAGLHYLARGFFR